MLHWGVSHGYLGLYVILALGMILPLPEDTTLLFAGYLVSRGQFELVPTWLAAYLGCMTGITISYTIGRTGGLMVVNRFGHHIGITPQRLERTTAWFHRVGKWSLLLGYFVPGVRHLAALVAGSSKVRFPVVMFFAGAGAMIWATMFLGLGCVLRDGWKRFGTGFNHDRPGIFIGVVLIMAACLYWDWRWQRERRRRQGTNSPGPVKAAGEQT